MDPGFRDRISDLHDRALECAPEQRHAFLENACNGDVALLEEVESLLVRKALARYSGNISQASEALGLSRSALYRRLQKYGI